MDALTIILIIVGGLAVVAFVVLAVMEIKRKSALRRQTSVGYAITPPANAGIESPQRPAVQRGPGGIDPLREPSPPAPPPEFRFPRTTEPAPGREPGAKAPEPETTAPASGSQVAPTPGSESGFQSDPKREAAPQTSSFPVESREPRSKAEPPVGKSGAPAGKYVEPPISSESQSGRPRQLEQESAATSEEVRSAEPPPSVSGTQTKLAARLAVMEVPFDRETAQAVGKCTEGDLEAMRESGLLRADESTGLLSWSENLRRSAAAVLSAEEEDAARLRHVQHFLELAKEAHKGAPGGPDHRAGAVVMEFSDHDRRHFEAGFEFLTKSPARDRELLDYVLAVAHPAVITHEPPKAAQWYEAALAAARALKDRPAEGEVLDNLGSIHAAAERHEQALTCFEEAAAISRELGNRHQEGRNVGNMGRAWHALKQLGKAIECYERVLAVMDETGDRGRVWIAYANLGQAASDMGDHRKALGYFEQQLEVARDNGDQRAEAISLSHIGSAHRALGETQTALGVFDRELTTARALRDLHLEGNALGKLGEAHSELGHHDKAAECFERQVEVANLVGNAEAGVRAMGQVGLAHHGAGRTTKALDWLDEQLKIARRIGDREGEALALWYSAQVVHARGQIVDAVTRASAALPILETIGSPEVEEVSAAVGKWRSRIS